MTHPFTEENKLKIRKVGEHLLGTCQSLEDGLATEFGEDTDLTQFDIKLLEDLDDITMRCEQCGWWCETGFLNDNQVCEDCDDAPDED